MLKVFRCLKIDKTSIKSKAIDFAYLVGPQGNLSTTFCAASHITIVADMSNSISEFCSQANLAGRI